jgi:hypothetical protein
MIPLSGRVPGRASGPSRSRDDDGGGLQYVSWKSVHPLGFSQHREFIGRRAMPGVKQGPTPPSDATKGWPMPPYGAAASWSGFISPLHSVFPSGKYELWLLFRPTPRIFPI